MIIKNIQSIGLSLACILLSGWLSAQAVESNPFDLRPRLPLKEQRASEKAELERLQEPLEDLNPFDIEIINTEEIEVFTPSQPNYNIQKPEPYFEKPSNVSGSQFAFWVSIILFLFLAIIFILLREDTFELFRSIFNENLLTLYYRDRLSGNTFPTLLILYFFFALNTGFLIWHFVNIKDLAVLPNLNNWLKYGVFSLALIILFFLKHLLLAIIAMIFPLRKPLSKYSFNIMVYNSVLGILLFFINILLTYLPAGMASTVLWIALFITIIIYAIKYLRSLFAVNRLVILHKFHFLLYLCTVEIAPALILYKLMFFQ